MGEESRVLDQIEYLQMQPEEVSSFPIKLKVKKKIEGGSSRKGPAFRQNRILLMIADIYKCM